MPRYVSSLQDLPALILLDAITQATEVYETVGTAGTAKQLTLIRPWIRAIGRACSSPARFDPDRLATRIGELAGAELEHDGVHLDASQQATAGSAAASAIVSALPVHVVQDLIDQGEFRYPQAERQHRWLRISTAIDGIIDRLDYFAREQGKEPYTQSFVDLTREISVTLQQGGIVTLVEPPQQRDAQLNN